MSHGETPDYEIPLFSPCSVLVDRPTLSRHPENGINLQWYGEATRLTPNAYQFLFPLPVDPDSVFWMGHPEQCEVLFLDRLHNYPNQDARDMFSDYSPNDVVAIAAAHHYQLEGPSSTPMFTMPVNVVLGDPNVGPIIPCSFEFDRQRHMEIINTS